MLSVVLTLRRFDTVGSACPTGSVFGHSEGEEKLALPRNGQGFFVSVTNFGIRAAASPAQFLPAPSRYQARFRTPPPVPARWCRSGPSAHEAHSSEQVPLDHQAVEAPDALLRVDPVQDQMALDRGAEIVRHQQPIIVS